MQHRVVKLYNAAQSSVDNTRWVVSSKLRSHDSADRADQIGNVVNASRPSDTAHEQISAAELRLGRLSECRNELEKLRQTPDRDTYIADVLADCARVQARINQLRVSCDTTDRREVG